MTHLSLAPPEMHVGISTAEAYVVSEAPPDRIPDQSILLTAKALSPAKTSTTCCFSPTSW